jgi:hypothetical protein
MLNGKYIILGDDFSPVINPHTFGNCWFVDSAVPAATPDEEITLIGAADLRNTAVIGDDFQWARKAIERNGLYAAGEESSLPASAIELIHYAPNELRYAFSTERERAAVFSEIFYPKGWKAWIEPAGEYGEVRNGHYKPTAQAQEIDLFRANWMLRGAILPAGEGQLIMRFEPESYRIGENISRASSITLILLLLCSIVGAVLTSRKARA